MQPSFPGCSIWEALNRLENVQKKIGNAAKWSSITEVVAKLISPFTNAVLARLLLPEAFGAVATINMVISFAEIFADAGFQKYIIQHEFESEEALDESSNVAFWTNITISLLIWSVICLFRNQLAAMAGDATLGNGMAVASLTMMMISFSSIQMARFKRKLDFRSMFVSRMVATFIPLVVTVPLALLLRNYWALIFGTLTAQLAQAVFLTLKSKWRPQFRYSWQRLKEMISFSIWTLVETISIWLTSYIDTFIVGNVLNNYYLGLYKTSMSTVNSYTAIITNSVVPVLFSALSRLQNDEQAFRDVFFKVQRMLAMLVFPMCAGLYLYRGLVTRILLGANWTETTDFIGLWALMSGATIVLSSLNSEVYRSKGRPKVSLLGQILHLLVLIPVLIITVERGFETLYVARSLVRLQLIVVGWFLMWWVARISPWLVARNVLPALLATSVMWAVSLLLQQFGQGTLWELASVGICIVVYAGMILAMPTTRRDLLSIGVVRKILKKSPGTQKLAGRT